MPSFPFLRKKIKIRELQLKSCYFSLCAKAPRTPKVKKKKYKESLDFSHQSNNLLLFIG